MEAITVETTIAQPLEKVWHDYTTSQAIESWNHASDDWHTTRAENDLQEGGSFVTRMEAKDGSEGFDLRGTYTKVIEQEHIAYTLEDGRKVFVTFLPSEEGVHIIQTFEPEQENTPELQQAGWQAILDNFKKYAEG